MTDSTRDWQELDRAHHVHPFTDPQTILQQGVKVITRGEGVYVWDSAGNKILDGMAGLWCVNVGYGRRELVEAATRQMEILPYYNTFWQTSTPPQIELVEQLASVTPPGLDHFFFTNSGSEANDTIIRLVRHYWKAVGKPSKHVFIGRTLAYHGSTLGAVSLGGMKPMHDMEPAVLPGFAHIMHPHWYALGGDLTPEEFGIRAARALEEKILELGPDNVAAFIGDPVQGAGGVIDPPRSYWPEIERICRKYDILLVADEVICGFGRTGNWFGCETFGFSPDLMTMAKGLSSGYLPIAAVAMNGRVFEGLSRGGLLSHGYTYSGHPVASAVAVENIRLIKREGLVERVRDDIGPYFRAALQDLADSHPIVGELRGAGLMAALQLVRDKSDRTPFADGDNPAIRCRDICLENKLIMRAVGQAMILSPALVISRSEVDELVDKARIGLDATARMFGLL